MKIGMIQGSSQRSKNKVLEASLLSSLKNKEHEIINFGVYEEDQRTLSYVEIALCISLLLESGAIDFIVTGCSSGQGMMLACNSLPGVICGYVENVTDAYLFGRINNGNAISYPLGFQWGWGAELNVTETLKALFTEPMGIGYPEGQATRKRQDALLVKDINSVSKRRLVEVLSLLDKKIVQAALQYEVVYEYIMEHGKNKELQQAMQDLKDVYK